MANKKIGIIAVLLAVVFGSAALHADARINGQITQIEREVQSLENLVDRIIRAGNNPIRDADERELMNIARRLQDLQTRINNRNFGEPTEQQQRRLNDLFGRGNFAVERLWASGLQTRG